MSYYTAKYNPYRKRRYAQSDTQRRNYAQIMDNLETEFAQLPDWIISSALDSCYKRYDQFRMRLSNHSADNPYHDLQNGQLLVNYKASKLRFLNLIKSGEIDEIAQKISKLKLTHYRFINIVNSKANCYYKNYKTKKDVFDLAEL